MNFKIFISVAILLSVIALIHGHGLVLDPVSRASRWRYDPSAPQNYDDSGLFCGGFGIQWGNNGGKCGLCGDNYADPAPRRYELGGTDGQGIIVKQYRQENVMPVSVYITANHMGFFRFNLCNIDKNQESEACFAQYPLKTTAGSEKYYLNSRLEGWYNTTLVLPTGVACKHCVLQWTYNTGNSWGVCDNGTQGMGCGAQEWFRACSDISIA